MDDDDVTDKSQCSGSPAEECERGVNSGTGLGQRQRTSPVH